MIYFTVLIEYDTITNQSQKTLPQSSPMCLVTIITISIFLVARIHFWKRRAVECDVPCFHRIPMRGEGSHARTLAKRGYMTTSEKCDISCMLTWQYLTKTSDGHKMAIWKLWIGKLEYIQIKYNYTSVFIIKPGIRKFCFFTMLYWRLDRKISKQFQVISQIAYVY